MGEEGHISTVCSDCAIDMMTDEQRDAATKHGPALAVAMWFLIMAINKANEQDAFLMHCPFDELNNVVAAMNPIFGKAH